jgi:predicted 3-demethylubiquinone-9 3-methyltransferase (glyoxalase superfamily)
MDEETAMAFAGHCFQQLHPRETVPLWLPRCTVIGWTKDKFGRFIVSFSITPTATNDAFDYFSVAVDQTTAETTVLEDRDLNTLNGPDFQGF